MLLAGCAAAGPDGRRVALGSRKLTTGAAAVTGAIEITVHGWDILVVCRASGRSLRASRPYC
jgi:hypothetical protein